MDIEYFEYADCILWNATRSYSFYGTMLIAFCWSHYPMNDAGMLALYLPMLA